MMMGRRVNNPPLAILINQLLKAFPGYTVKTLLEEDAEVILDLLAVENAQGAVAETLRKQRA
jgi:hypothetical protein